MDILNSLQKKLLLYKKEENLVEIMTINRRIIIDIEANDNDHAFLIYNDILGAISRRTTVYQSTGPEEVPKTVRGD